MKKFTVTIDIPTTTIRDNNEKLIEYLRRTYLDGLCNAT